MATYTIEVTNSRGQERFVTRKRFDAFQYQAHKAVYDAAEAQGLRDRPVALEALRRVYDMGKGGLSNIQIGDYWVILNS